MDEGGTLTWGQPKKEEESERDTQQGNTEQDKGLWQAKTKGGTCI